MESPEGLIVQRGLEGLAEQEGDRVLAIVRRSVRGGASDLEIEQTLAHIFTLGANDKVVRIDAFWTRRRHAGR